MVEWVDRVETLNIYLNGRIPNRWDLRCYFHATVAYLQRENKISPTNAGFFFSAIDRLYPIGILRAGYVDDKHELRHSYFFLHKDSHGQVFCSLPRSNMHTCPVLNWDTEEGEAGMRNLWETHGEDTPVVDTLLKTLTTLGIREHGEGTQARPRPDRVQAWWLSPTHCPNGVMREKHKLAQKKKSPCLAGVARTPPVEVKVREEEKKMEEVQPQREHQPPPACARKQEKKDKTKHDVSQKKEKEKEMLETKRPNANEPLPEKNEDKKKEQPKNKQQRLPPEQLTPAKAVSPQEGETNQKKKKTENKNLSNTKASAENKEKKLNDFFRRGSKSNADQTSDSRHDKSKKRLRIHDSPSDKTNNFTYKKQNITISRHAADKDDDDDEGDDDDKEDGDEGDDDGNDDGCDGDDDGENEEHTTNKAEDTEHNMKDQDGHELKDQKEKNEGEKKPEEEKPQNNPLILRKELSKEKALQHYLAVVKKISSFNMSRSLPQTIRCSLDETTPSRNYIYDNRSDSVSITSKITECLNMDSVDKINKIRKQHPEVTKEAARLCKSEFKANACFAFAFIKPWDFFQFVDHIESQQESFPIWVSVFFFVVFLFCCFFVI